MNLENKDAPIFSSAKSIQREIETFVSDLHNPKVPFFLTIGAVFLLIILAAVDFLFLDVFSTSWNFIFYGSIVLFLFFIGVFILDSNEVKIRKEMPTSTISSASNSEVELLGKIQSTNGLKVSPFFGVECLDFNASISIRTKGGRKGRSSKTLAEFSDEKYSEGFYLMDDTGTVLISEIDMSAFKYSFSRSLSKKKSLSVLKDIETKYEGDDQKQAKIFELKKIIQEKMRDNPLLSKVRVGLFEIVTLGDILVMLTGQITEIPIEDKTISAEKFQEFLSSMPEKSWPLDKISNEISKIQKFVDLHNEDVKSVKVLTKLENEVKILQTTKFIEEDSQIKRKAIDTFMATCVCVFAVSLSYLL